MPKTSDLLPLVVWEHGGGEVLATSYEGANLKANRGAVVWPESGHKTAVLSVQYPANYGFEVTTIPEEFELMKKYNTAKYELISKLIADGKVDADRVYISGVSSGGGGALRFIMQYPDLFAAALVVAAKDTVIPLSLKHKLAYQMSDVNLLRLSDEVKAKEYENMLNEVKDAE